MKRLTYILTMTLAIVFNAQSQPNSNIDSLTILQLDSLNFFPFDTILISGFKSEINRIVKYDTISKNQNEIKQVIGLDNSGDTVLEISINVFISSSITAGPKVRIYNRNNQILLEEYRDVHGTTWHRYKYLYDNKNLLQEKSGFTSGEVGVKTKYKYDQKGIIIEEINYIGGKEVSREKHCK